ncbi:hypothetical protein N1851_032986 [Merluccius polli]|uniref:DUF5641 domain-containing protein n=1 Tax=Merluccius polli TaxID=89951 RepID=A0AA47NN86_MERPO|nr:hypothetical protein N1851_032986 [Merluccius polli]
MRNEWPMALVIKAHPSSDGKVRKLELKVTKGGTVKTFFRPITECSPALNTSAHQKRGLIVPTDMND